MADTPGLTGGLAMDAKSRVDVGDSPLATPSWVARSHEVVVDAFDGLAKVAAAEELVVLVVVVVWPSKGSG
jgi:hypothetical protein